MKDLEVTVTTEVTTAMVIVLTTEGPIDLQVIIFHVFTTQLFTIQFIPRQLMNPLIVRGKCAEIPTLVGTVVTTQNVHMENSNVVVQRGDAGAVKTNKIDKVMVIFSS